MLKADLHIHTVYSPDCLSSPGQIVARCLKVGINCLAVTDHNAVAGAQGLKRIAPFTVIVGEEVLTAEGEIIGLFLERLVPKHLSPEETVARIKEQGGLVCIPHPCDRFRRSPLRPQALERILPSVDVIEVFNSRTWLLRDSARAKQIAASHGLPGGAGSDAHTIDEIGTSYVELPEFDNALHFLGSLRRGHVTGHRAKTVARLAAYFQGARARVVKRMGGRSNRSCLLP
ncbi:MAG: PHP domain-containing protein [Chloroflexi bacterium]|nr:PHP domain-containing protein [Chloroflexota bacterium]